MGAIHRFVMLQVRYIEMNADASDIARSIHAHPILTETLGFAAEAFEGTITDMCIPRKK